MNNEKTRAVVVRQYTEEHLRFEQVFAYTSAMFDILAVLDGAEKPSPFITEGSSMARGLYKQVRYKLIGLMERADGKKDQS